jgi:hypothetical protein
MVRGVALILCLFTVAGCEEEPRGSAADHESGPNLPDAGPTDAGLTDAGLTDAPADAALADAPADGSTIDGGSDAAQVGWPAQGPVSYLPIVPGARGFGMQTPAGSGRHLTPTSTTVITVTSLAAEGPGSLKAAIEASGPRTVIFEVSGTIKLPNKPLAVKNPYITIAGQTAPSPGIMIRGRGIVVVANDVLIQHLRIRPGDDYEGNNVDGVNVDGYKGNKPSRIVFDHLTVNWATDELVGTWNDVGEVTFHRCIFSEGLHDSVHVDEGKPPGTYEPHSCGPLFGSFAGKVSGVGCLLSNNSIRQPRTGVGQLVWVNNLHYNRWQNFAELYNKKGQVSLNTFVGNVYIEGNSLQKWAKTKPIQVQSSFAAPSKLYVEDNVSPDWPTSTPWDLVTNSSPSKTAIQATKPPVLPDGLVAAKTANDLVKQLVLATAGARPTDRDKVEQRLVNEVMKGTGNYVNCVAPNGPGKDCASHNAGGWPSYAKNVRKLTVPANANVIQPSGYTKLEEWLHDQSIWKVE